MADEHQAVHPQQRPGAVLPVVHLLPHLVEGRPEGQARRGVPGPALDGRPKLVHDEVRHPLHRLDDDVAGEAVGDDDVGDVRGDMLPLYVADEVEVALGQQGVGLLGQRTPLRLLFADVQQRHPGPFHLPRPLHVGRGHLGELHQVAGLAVRVGADVQENGELAGEGHEAHQGGPRDALDAAQVHDGSGHHGPGVAGGDERPGLPRLDHAQADDDGGILLVAGGLSRLLVHLDHLGGGDDGDGIGLASVFGQLHGDGLRRAHQGDAEAQLPGGPDGSGHDLAGGVVAPHGVQGNDEVSGHGSTIPQPEGSGISPAGPELLR